MNQWVELLNVERQKLNQLGNESLANGTRYFENEALQAQSRKVDELIIQLFEKSGSVQRSS